MKSECNIWLPMWEAWITVLSCRLRKSSQKGRNRLRKSKKVSRKHLGFPQTHTQTHTWLSGLAAVCCHLVSETSRWNDGKGWKVERMCVPRQRTEEDRLVLRYYLYKCNVIASAIHYSLPSRLITIPFSHTCIPFTSPSFLCITHSARHVHYVTPWRAASRT